MTEPLTESESQQLWADSMTDEEREAYEDGVAQRRAERQAAREAIEAYWRDIRDSKYPG